MWVFLEEGIEPEAATFFIGIGVERPLMAPTAIVPSWQERHSFVDPFGCSAVETIVDLLYVWNLPLDVVLWFQRGPSDDVLWLL